MAGRWLLFVCSNFQTRSETWQCVSPVAPGAVLPRLVVLCARCPVSGPGKKWLSCASSIASLRRLGWLVNSVVPFIRCATKLLICNCAKLIRQSGKAIRARPTSSPKPMARFPGPPLAERLRSVILRSAPGVPLRRRTLVVHRSLARLPAAPRSAALGSLYGNCL